MYGDGQNMWKQKQISYRENSNSMEKFLPIDLDGIKEDRFTRGEILLKGGYCGDSVSLFWIVSGQCKALINGKEQIMNADDMFYILYREGYRLECLSDECRFQTLSFFGPLAEPLMLAYRFPRFLTLERNVEPIWRELLELSCSYSEQDRRHVIALILDIFSCVGESSNEENTEERLIARARHLIFQNLSDPQLGIDFLCEKLRISRSRLSVLFHHYLKESPGREILNRRHARAVRLLQGTDHTIAQIAGECGFRDPKTFSRFIHRTTGYGPREFRERSQNRKK